MKQASVPSRRLWLGGIPALILAGALAACGPATQQAAPGELATAKGDTGEPVATTPEIQAVEDVATARRLAEYGQRTRSPMALIAAAQILINTPRQDLEGEPEDRAGEATARGAEQQKAAQPRERLEPSSLLAEARRLAAGDENLLALIQQLQARAEASPRGAVGGPQSGYYIVQANRTNVHTIRFRANEPAVIYMEGDGDTDLDLYVYDENGNFIVADRGYTDVGSVRWVPRWTGAFRVEVRNLGWVWNEYYLATN